MLFAKLVNAWGKVGKRACWPMLWLSQPRVTKTAACDHIAHSTADADLDTGKARVGGGMITAGWHVKSFLLWMYGYWHHSCTVRTQAMMPKNAWAGRAPLEGTRARTTRVICSEAKSARSEKARA